MNADGSGQRLIGCEDYPCLKPMWSPSGEFLIYAISPYPIYSQERTLWRAVQVSTGQQFEVFTDQVREFAENAYWANSANGDYFVVLDPVFQLQPSTLIKRFFTPKGEEVSEAQVQPQDVVLPKFIVTQTWDCGPGQVVCQKIAVMDEPGFFFYVTYGDEGSVWLGNGN